MAGMVPAARHSAVMTPIRRKVMRMFFTVRMPFTVIRSISSGVKPFRAARLKKITRPASSAHRIENFSRRLASRMAQKSTSVKSSMG